MTVALLAISGVLYAVGATRMRTKFWQALSFVVGWLALVAALLSPLDELAERYFSAHMAQHELLMMVAAPLMVLGRPLVAFLWALPMSWRLRIGGGLKHVSGAWHFVSAPIVATFLHAIALWVWHLPSLYQATLGNEAIHATQHLCFFLTAALFWYALLHGRYGRLGYGAAVGYVFITAAHSGILGALIALSPNVIYPIYGKDAIDDQQLAGILMWIPAGVIFTVVGVALFAAWLGEAERRVELGERASRPRPSGVAPDGSGSHAAGQDALPSRARRPLSLFLLLLLAACNREQQYGDAKRGRQLIEQYGCTACHVIPGVRGPKGMVGPPLDHIGSRTYLAGKFANTPETMTKWLQNPQAMDPQNAMPNLNVTAADSRDITAFLFSLK